MPVTAIQPGRNCPSEYTVRRLTSPERSDVSALPMTDDGRPKAAQLVLCLQLLRPLQRRVRLGLHPLRTIRFCQRGFGVSIVATDFLLLAKCGDGLVVVLQLYLCQAQPVIHRLEIRLQLRRLLVFLDSVRVVLLCGQRSREPEV